MNNISPAFHGINPATNEALDPEFVSAPPADLERAYALADAAFDTYRETSLEDRATF
jgi:NADP-dependent aldehyde dehydrogenase